MRMHYKEFIKQIVPAKVWEIVKNTGIKYFGLLANSSYAEVGEDILIYKLFHARKGDMKLSGFKKNGFYIDIGCNHPALNSQTYFFYKKGWRGITVDPSPTHQNLFKKMRPHDLYFPLGISSKPGKLAYYVYDLNVINSFDKEASAKIARELNSKLLDVKEVEVARLDDLLKAHLGKHEIDFLSVDAEGHEFEIIQSNDWNTYRPKFVLLEIHDFDWEHLNKSDVYNYMIEKRYKIVSVIGHNCLFEDIKNKSYSHFG